MIQTLPCEPVTGRLESLRSVLGTAEVARATIDTLKVLAPDDTNKPRLISWLERGLETGERRWEIRSGLRALARVLQPRSYLEIGTRRGWSLAQVLAESPETRVWSFDLWIPGYGDAGNPGPGFVREEMARAAPGHRGSLEFIDGNSHDTLPLFFGTVALEERDLEDPRIVRAGEEAPRAFDLVTVDGDHTAKGAWWDLADVVPHVAVGGVIVFDDLVDWSDERHGAVATSRYEALRQTPSDLELSLLGVWRRLQSCLPDFRFIENLDGLPPIGIAMRMR